MFQSEIRNTPCITLILSDAEAD